MNDRSTLIFITGGVRSGKSSFAERIALEKARDDQVNLHYIATGLPSDVEMKHRIDKHKQLRDQCSAKWKTWEQSQDIGILAKNFTSRDILLLDCVTTLLNNELICDETVHEQRVTDSIFYGIEQLRENCHSLIIVSNEILNEPIQSNELVLAYKRLLGMLHREIVAQADQAYLVESSIPILMKGESDERNYDTGDCI